jgi:hypothetical protein
MKKIIKIHTAGTIRKSNLQIVETETKYVQDCSLSWLDKGTTIRGGGLSQFYGHNLHS